MGRNNPELLNTETCTKCKAYLTENQERCSECGQPTRFMSFKSRAEYEVEQWKRYKAQASNADAS